MIDQRRIDEPEFEVAYTTSGRIWIGVISEGEYALTLAISPDKARWLVQRLTETLGELPPPA
jgi:hypothetical protein